MPASPFRSRSLTLVEAIVREGGLGRAAKRLGVSQSAVSQALSKLEEELGLPLFERTGRGVEPTPAGLRVAESARAVSRLLERLRADLSEQRSGRTGTLRVATECYTCYHWLPSTIARLRSEFPGYEVEIRPEATRRPLLALQDGELDLAITTSGAPEAGIVLHPLFRDELVAVMAPDHPLAGVGNLEPRDFADQTVICHFEPERSALVREFLLPAGVVARRTTSLQLTTAVLAAVRAGMGISVLASWVAASEVEAGHLVSRSLGPRGLHRQWSVASRAEDADTPAVAALIRLVAAERSLGAGSRDPRQRPGSSSRASRPT